MLTLERVVEHVPGKRLCAVTLPYSPSAFPLLRHRDAFVLEAMGQAGAVLVQSMEQFRGRTAYFARIRNVEWGHGGALETNGFGSRGDQDAEEEEVNSAVVAAKPVYAVRVALARLHGRGFGTVHARAFEHREPPLAATGDGGGGDGEEGGARSGTCDRDAARVMSGELAFKLLRAHEE